MRVCPSRLAMTVGVLAALAPVTTLIGASTVDPDPLFDRATLYFKPLPDAAPSPDNPVTAAKVELGRKLYFDKRLSRDGSVSCDSCHQLARFGVDNLPTSPGVAGQLGDRNSPTVLNAALHTAQFWDGRAEDVEEQAGMPILNPVEMAIPGEGFLVERLAGDAVYRDLFARAFPELHEPLTYETIRLALGAFERTLLTPSPFDAYLQGDRAALDDAAKAGLELFLDLGCASCHNGVNLGAAFFRKFGLNEPYWQHTKSEAVDEGRYALTGDEADKYVFRVASLRNVAETAPYFHDGSVEELEEAVEIMVALQVGLELSAEEVGQLTAFLESLTGELPEEVWRGIQKETPAP